MPKQNRKGQAKAKEEGGDLGTRFAAHWTAAENANKPLPITEIEAARAERRKNYATIAKDYYNLATDNLEMGWGPSFHFCPFPDPSESIDAAMTRHQHFLAYIMGLKPGMKGLDAGCGTGGPSREIARFAGVNVTGLSINGLHVQRATKYAKEESLFGDGPGQVQYREGDFMHIPFPDNHFDFVYATEATVYAPSLQAVYTEIARVLKPGGVFGVYEWLMTDEFDSKNPKHVEIRQRIERGDGVVNMLSVKEGLEAFRGSGLEMYHNENMALRVPPKRDPNQKEKTWWYCIDGDTSHTTNWTDWWLVFWLKKSFFRFGYGFTWLMIKARLAPELALEALRTQGMSVWGMRDGGREGIFTTSYLMVGRKPESWIHPGPKEE
ncbi:MAG: hypothetical protein L6R36_004339 [Xanthoria steineri]|nr:MAG: hypothetical protein L6R36_004339 [Xanthoria steineri]